MTKLAADVGRNPLDVRAAATLQKVAAADLDAFARRAAACYLLAGVAVDGFDPSRAWPGALSDFSPGEPAENIAIAAAILAASRSGHRGDA